MGSAKLATLAILMLFEAATLWVASMLHLLAAADPGSKSVGAGVAEATICAALIGGAIALLRRSQHGARIALATVRFAILGFVVGLTFTVRSGGADLVYHATMLPVLIATAVLLVWQFGRRVAD